jgi:hypothetical protein
MLCAEDHDSRENIPAWEFWLHSDSDETTIFYAISWFLLRVPVLPLTIFLFSLNVTNVLMHRVRINQITKSKKFFRFVSYSPAEGSIGTISYFNVTRRFILATGEWKKNLGLKETDGWSHSSLRLQWKKRNPKITPFIFTTTAILTPGHPAHECVRMPVPFPNTPATCI